jgi:hypothetical protein
MKAITEKEIKTKSGEILPIGSPVSFMGEDSPHLCLVKGQRPEPYRIRISSVFTPPNAEELEEQANDGVCDSILGERVEPDGYDEHGSPSWLLALRLI